MKKLGLIMILSIIMVSLTGIVSASSFDVGVNPIEVTAKQGESIEVKVDLKDIDMKEKGINTLEGYINFDEDVIENVEVETKNDWQIEYNKDSNSDLYGKFLMVKDIDGIKENEEVLTLKIKVKDKVKKESTKVILKDLTSNDGENLVNIGNKEININFEGVKAVNTGDNTIMFVTGIILSALVTYLISIKKDVKE
ncbi:MAG: cohesin domain-containing protein [Christensenellales bacterium]